MTNLEVFNKAVECARSHGVALYRVDRNGDAEYHSIGRDEESGKVTFYLSDATEFAVMALYILEMLFYSHERKWLDLGEEGAAAISGCIARIAARHKSEAVA